jgi:cob(I)alamin adenosyltransferase
MKIYTKTGDGGETGVWGGGRVPKDAIRINAYGTVDECNAVLGIARVYNPGAPLDGMLDRIQHLLFVVGSDLATPADVPTAIPRIGDADVSLLEEWIDQLESFLPPLKQFIIPGGCPAAAYLHVARTVCRRAERWTVSLSRQEPACATAVKFLNRLSDFLFVAARMANHLAGLPDIPWDNPRLRQKP